MMNIRFFIITCLLISSFIPIAYGQCGLKHIDEFPYVRQSNQSLCWGASLEMVLRYWQPDSSKCIDCAQERVKFIYETMVTKADSSDNISGLPASMYYGDYFAEHRDYYSAILAYYGMNSIQMVNGFPIALTEELIKEELCNCRPLIVIFDQKGPHVVILKSYEKRIDGSGLKLEFHDPWEGIVEYTTTAIETAPITALNKIGSDSLVAKIKTFVYGIEQNDISNKGRAYTPCKKLNYNYRKLKN
ncbi:MAG: C39 family peptidase [Saprospiraceae bacterium]